MKHMVIGQFNESFPPLMDGVGNVVKNYTEELIKRGHEVYAVTAGSKEGSVYDAEHAITYTIRCRMVAVPGLQPYGIVFHTPSFLNKVKKIPFDLVHAHSPFFQGKLAQKMAVQRQIPLVSTFHTQFKDDIKGFVKSEVLANAITKSLLKHYEAADQVWTPSEWSKKVLLTYGFDKEVLVVENGCDMEVPSDDELQNLRDSGYRFAGIEDDLPVLLYVGQHKTEKNIQLAINALALLKREGVRFYMLFAGVGKDKDAFVASVQKQGLSDAVSFLGRITDRDKLKSLYAIASLFLFPSLYDTSALVMREAAAYRLPLLYVSGSCTSESISDGVNGFIAENNESSYAAKIAWILFHPKERASAGEGAYKTLYRHWRDAVDEVEGRYFALVEHRPWHQESVTSLSSSTSTIPSAL